jgi:hypothetical protein
MTGLVRGTLIGLMLSGLAVGIGAAVRVVVAEVDPADGHGWGRQFERAWPDPSPTATPRTLTPLTAPGDCESPYSTRKDTTCPALAI